MSESSISTESMTGTLRKMRGQLGVNEQNTVQYFLPIGEQELHLNPLLGKHIRLSFQEQIFCSNCGRKTKKSFSQGHCYPCMQKLASCDMCIMKPETCHFDQGTCREPDWAQNHCFTAHYVYLSNTSGLKVGITRSNQIPTRWIDQGATQAITLFKVNTRQQSGFIEVAFKDAVADKTNWRAMLKGNAEPIDMLAKSIELKQSLENSLQQIIVQQGLEQIESLTSESVDIAYPVLEFPTKITSHNFDKTPLVEGTLMGIKGQYLIFDTGVINIRKFTSYQVSISV